MLNVSGQSCNKIVPTIRTEGKSLYLKGHTSWIRSPETSDPGQPLQKVARPQWHVHKSKMGMRHKAGMGMRKPEYGVETTYNPCAA